MKISRKTAGISLVALVVTIIVLIILTGAVIVTFMEGGIVDKAKESVFKNDIRTYQEQLIVIRGEDQIELSTQVGYVAKVMGKTIAGEDIKAILPEFKVEEYGELIKVVDGKIVAAKELDENVQKEKWLIDLEVEKAKENEEIENEVEVVTYGGMGNPSDDTGENINGLKLVEIYAVIDGVEMSYSEIKENYVNVGHTFVIDSNSTGTAFNYWVGDTLRINDNDSYRMITDYSYIDYGIGDDMYTTYNITKAVFHRTK